MGGQAAVEALRGLEQSGQAGRVAAAAASILNGLPRRGRAIGDQHGLEGGCWRGAR